jgi:SAM-dependent methyltransferase
MSVEEYRRQSLENWETMAAGWEKRAAEIDEVGAPVLEWLIAALAPKQGDVVLELASGPGSAGLAASPLVGEGGRVISTDFSPAMVEVARRRADGLGVTNVEHLVMDAGEIELEDGSVDGVVCRWGYMLMPDPVAAFAETRRVLRSGGRLAFSVWRGPDVVAHFRYEDVDDYVRVARDTGGQFGKAWDNASEEDQAAMKAELEERFAPFRGEDGYVMTGVAACVLAS